MPQQTIPIQEHKLKIIKIIDETPTVKTFRAEIPRGAEISFLPGQFFMVRLLDNPKLQRAYSIASSPLQKTYSRGLMANSTLPKKLKMISF